ncbi:hypothetical protein [Elizabethkingia anophelis]|uniref:hypothetical protein n=1 Tax=Elizabethkingia anophelis TaxID=1117645 RepID=UPI0002437AA3|nr:hypothetical protein [Elizabethkingia anophelis]ATC39612.1 hypothetical protein EAAG1_007000 [Elizabethkingia anophelis Ag1]ATC43291.1 hypothetical protein CMV41_07000 [Elizabethkingia anophelis]ATC46967.1 hypothetical protein CMV40_07000 [Elizabethkingia anophelis]MCQ0429371.1 hypothetical protein [Elizabethkingia anophelis]
MKIKLKTIVWILLGCAVGWLLINVRLKETYETQTILDKMIVGNRSGMPQYYVIIKDSLGNISQKETGVENYAIYKVGKKYRFSSLKIVRK